MITLCVRLAGAEIVPAAVLWEGMDEAKALALGARRLYVLPGQADACQGGYQIAAEARSYAPQAILFSATPHGRIVAATAAALLQTGLAADCIEIRSRTDGLLVMTRPAFGGSLMADIVCPMRKPQMATIRPGAYLPKACVCQPCNIERVMCSTCPGERRTKLLKRIPNNLCAPTLSRIIVAGGLGVGSREGFALLGQLATAIGGAVGASRAAVHAGYADYIQQIGLTGQIVRPDLYLAFGISGAVQHLVGMENSRTIIAINADPHASIFEYADYGIVGDWKEIVSGLLQRLSAR